MDRLIGEAEGSAQPLAVYCIYFKAIKMSAQAPYQIEVIPCYLIKHECQRLNFSDAGDALKVMNTG